MRRPTYHRKRAPQFLVRVLSLHLAFHFRLLISLNPSGCWKEGKGDLSLTFYGLMAVVYSQGRLHWTGQITFMHRMTVWVLHKLLALVLTPSQENSLLTRNKESSYLYILDNNPIVVNRTTHIYKGCKAPLSYLVIGVLRHSISIEQST